MGIGIIELILILLVIFGVAITTLIIFLTKRNKENKVK
jgi:hypothetical protein